MDLPRESIPERQQYQEGDPSCMQNNRRELVLTAKIVLFFWSSAPLFVDTGFVVGAPYGIPFFVFAMMMLFLISLLRSFKDLEFVVAFLFGAMSLWDYISFGLMMSISTFWDSFPCAYIYIWSTTLLFLASTIYVGVFLWYVKRCRRG